MQWKCRGGPETIFIEECVRYRGGLGVLFYGEYQLFYCSENRKLKYNHLKNIKKYGS